jgi:hypothetical protein
VSWTGKRSHLVLPILLFALALLIRAPGLGKWCLTVDEFYFYRAVSFIMEKGVPEFPGGGYYTRGIALQYLTALPVSLIEDRETAVRIVPLASGALMVPLFFVFCRKFLGIAESLICALMLLLSSWHIEFSRFARMYMPFQLLFLLFLYFAHSGFRENVARHRMIAWAVAALAVLTYEGSIILVFLLAAFLLTGDAGKTPRELSRFTVAVILLILLNLAANLVDYRHMGVGDIPPAASGGALPEAAGTRVLPVVLPGTGLLAGAWSTGAGRATLVLLALAAAGLLVRAVRSAEGPLTRGILLLSVLPVSVLPLIHQYALLLLLAALYAMHREDVRAAVGKDLPLWGGYVFMTLLFWTGVAALSGNLDRFRHFFAGYPPVRYAVAEPFMMFVPMWTVFLLAVVGVSLFRNVLLRGTQGDPFPLTVLVLCLVLVAIFRTPYRSTRYSFFLFPLFLVVCMSEAQALRAYLSARYRSGIGKKAGAALLAVPLSVFVMTEDFHLRHVVDVSSADINFRTGAYARFADHWYPRADLKTPGLFLDDVYREGDVVVLEQVAGSLYLKESFINYVADDSDRFRITARMRDGGGIEEAWTGRHMISKPSELAAMVPGNGRNSLWVMGIVRDFPGGTLNLERRREELAREFGLRIDLAFVGIDGRIGVWRLKRLEPSGAELSVRRPPWAMERRTA